MLQDSLSQIQIQDAKVVKMLQQLPESFKQVPESLNNFPKVRNFREVFRTREDILNSPIVVYESSIPRPGCIFHIFNHAVGNDKLFISEDNYRYFLGRYQDFIPPIADTLAYCLMSNHLHFVVEIKDDINVPDKAKHSKSQFVSKQFSNLFSSYWQAFNKQQKRMGNLFISNFKRSKIETDEYLSNVIKYVHLNPVRHRVTKNIRQWKFCSYEALCSRETTFLAREKTLRWFGGLDEFRKYHEFAPEGLGNFPKV